MSKGEWIYPGRLRPLLQGGRYAQLCAGTAGAVIAGNGGFL